MGSPFTSTGTISSTLQKGDDAAYSTTHDAATADSEETGGALYLGQNSVFAVLYYIRRGVVRFPLDLDGSDELTAVVTGVVFHGYGQSGTQDDSSGDSISIVSFSPANAADPAVADYDQLGTTKWATDKLISTFSIGADNTMTFNAAGIAAVQAALGTGYIWLGFRNAFDIANTTPTHNPQVLVDGVSQPNKPYLVISYTLPASGHQKNLVTMGVG